MIKINYPEVPKLLEDYYKKISNITLLINSGTTKGREKFNAKVNCILDKKIYTKKNPKPKRLSLEKIFNLFKENKVYGFDDIFEGINFCELLIADFEQLKQLKNKIGESKKYCNEIVEIIKIIFNYTDHQDKISDFFQKSKIDLKTCYYCNLDYINIIKYYDKEDFIRHVSEEKLKSLTENTKIIEEIKILKEDISQPVSKETENFLDEKIEDFNSANFYTFDHFFDKATYPYLALSLKNLVPSCHACNSKIKHSKSIGDFSPTSELFDFDDKVKFILIQGDNKLIKDILKNPKDIKVCLSDNYEYDEYSKNLRLNARYSYSNHQEEATDLIRKYQDYPKEKITELSTLLGLDEDQIRKDIFGKMILSKELNEYPYTKLKQDVYNCLLKSSLLRNEND